MRVLLEDAGRRTKCRVPFIGCPAVECPTPCPHCGADGTGMHIQGVPGTMQRTHYGYVADARCIACGAIVGRLVVTMDTLFGTEEDERVLHYNRCRVY